MRAQPWKKRLLTDAEKQKLPDRLAGEYRFWIRYQVGMVRKTHRYWFRSADDREAYRHELEDRQLRATGIDQGEEVLF